MNNVFKNVTTWSLLKFAAPTMLMTVFMSFYTIVDGMFVSRFVNTDALSAVNIVYPLISIVTAVGIMLGTGGSAIISQKAGAGKPEEARQNFSFIFLSSLIIGIVISGASILFMNMIIYALGSNNAIFLYCHGYLFTLAFFFPLGMLQMLLQFMFVAAGKPKIGLILILTGGIANIALDYIFIAKLGMGVMGAALATGIGYSIVGIYGTCYFLFNRRGWLYLVKPKTDWRVLLNSCTNGSSEMVTNLSGAIVTYMFNLVMMHYIGQNGVAATTIVLYAEYMFISVNLGYSSGVAPLISYNYGSGNNDNLKKIFSTSKIFIGVLSVIVFGSSLLFGKSIVGMFTPSGSVFDLAFHGFSISSIAFLFMGYNIFASSLFTAFSNGKVSAILSFMRSLVFLIVCLITLTRVFGVNGLWMSLPISEILSVCLSTLYIRRFRGIYKYAV